MVSQGRALALAAAGIVIALTVAAVTFTVAHPGREGWNAVVPALGFAGVVYLTPVALLVAAIWIARRSGRARSTAALGAQAALAGLTAVALALAAFIAAHGN